MKLIIPNLRLDRRGFTLIETIVVIAVIGLLVTLLLPTLQSARESARRTQCINNLHQLGLGVHGYLSSFDCMPPGHFHGGYSLHVPLLPYLELTPIYQAINFDVRPFLPTYRDRRNETASSRTIALFLRPSDGSRSGLVFGRLTNYAGNIGFGYCEGLPYHACNNGSVSLTQTQTIKPADFRDGLSQTALMSEWLFSPSPVNRIDPKRTLFQLFAPPNSEREFEASVVVCRSLPTATTPFEPDGRGFNWQHGTIAMTTYTHAMGVNERSCVNGSSTLLGMVTATSLHRGGVNVLWSDGRVGFVRDSLSPQVWRALGTRAGGDLSDIH